MPQCSGVIICLIVTNTCVDSYGSVGCGRYNTPRPCKVGRRLGMKNQFLTSDRMNKAKPRGVQRLPGHVQYRFAAVNGIRNQRVSARGQMHADLVRASGVQRALQCTESTLSRQSQHVCAGRFTAAYNGHSDT